MVVNIADSQSALTRKLPEESKHLENSERDLLIVDWSNMIHRTFHSLGAKDDLLSHDICLIAEQNIRSMTQGVLFPGWRIAIVLDGGYSGRKEIYGGYKSERMRSEDRAPSLVHALSGPTREQAQRMTVVQVFGFEADDVMAALAHAHTGNSYILSADRDLLQAVDDSTFLLVPKGPYDAPEVFGVDEVQQKYGFPPALIPHYKALQGDKADDVPQIPRVGHGTACRLVCDYGNIEGAIRAALEGRLTPKLTQSLVFNRDTIALNLRLVTLVDVPGIEDIYLKLMERG